MATVTNTDFVRDFSGVADTNPYAVSGVTEIDGVNDDRIISGALCNVAGASAGDTVEWRHRITGTAGQSLLTASVEMKGTGSYNVKGPGIFAADGSGYFFGVNFNQFHYLYRVNADQTKVELASFDAGSGFADATRLHLTLDTSNGQLRCYNEGTLITDLNATDTTYNTGLMPGFAMLGMDGGMPGFISIGGDYGATSGASETEQEGFRFRNDDGSESTATWKAAQDTDANVNLDTNIRLRMLLNTTNDLASKGFKLLYRKVGETQWREL